MFRRFEARWPVARPISLLLLLLILSGCQEGPTGPALLDPTEVEKIPFERLSGRIAFRRELPGQDYVSHLMILDGEERRLDAVVSFPRAVLSNLDWSPQGDLLAFAFFALYGTSGMIWQIYIMPAYGGSAFPLTNRPAHSSYPSWAPDGKRIAYWSALTGSSIWVVHVDTLLHRRLFDVSWSTRTRPAWSPDGKTMVVVSEDSLARATLYRVRLDTLRAEVLFSADEAMDVVLLKSPIFSPDGRQIAFVYYTVDPSLPDEIWVMEADGSEPRPLTDGPRDWNPAWSPDGSQIVFSRNGDLFLVRVDGSDLVPLTSGAAEDEYPAWVGN